MENFPLFLMQGIPESIGLISLSLALAGVQFLWVRIILAGTVFSIFMFIIRALPFTFGMHTVAGMLLLVIFIAKTTRVPLSRCFIAVFISFATLAVLELIICELFFAITKLNFQAVISNYFLWKLVSLPQAVFLIIFAVLISKFKKPVQGAWKI